MSSLRPKQIIVVAAIAVICGLIGLVVPWAASPLAQFLNPQQTAPLSFVGSEICATCHAGQADLWRQSQHAHAMDHATTATVLGKFGNQTFEDSGVQSRFFTRDNKYFVETEGPDGTASTFQIKYTFGVEPLQQYLVEFPDGRIQALTTAWDTRTKEKGGQRWFQLYPHERIAHDDVLHWTKLNQNWNFMCAECHSTGVRKNYDQVADRFATTFAEISVGCEACHGQGSRHVGWARAKQSWWPSGKVEEQDFGLLVRFAERLNVTWDRAPSSDNPKRSVAPSTLRKEVETCGLCHARRAEFSEGWVPGRPLSDTHMVSGLTRDLYQPDGQMRDEVYNYGSFKQSKMFAAGVTCGDCHEPHSGKVRFEGDGLCMQCHSTDKFAAASHHRHEGVEPKVACASCHMPVRTYMIVDPRHDHGFRVPRPDISVQAKTSNTCNDCHTDKTPQWAADQIATWHGPNRKGFQTWAPALDAAWNDRPQATQLLAALASNRTAPAIARAAALTELAHFPSASSPTLARAGLANEDPMVRIGALDMLEGAPPAQLWSLVSPLLTDRIRGVRIRAVSLLAGTPMTQRSADERRRFENAVNEFIAAQRQNADRPEARTALGSFFARQGRVSEAESEFKAALRLSGQFAPAAINLADMFRQTGRESNAEQVLREGLAVSPHGAALHYALGLTLVRLKRDAEALSEFHEAAVSEPDNARYVYVYSVALRSAGKIPEAIEVLVENNARHPADRDTLAALVNFNRDAGNYPEALRQAQRLASVVPPDPALNQLIEDLRHGVTRRAAP